MRLTVLLLCLAAACREETPEEELAAPAAPVPLPPPRKRAPGLPPPTTLPPPLPFDPSDPAVEPIDGAIPAEADPQLAAFSWTARSADGRVEWTQKGLAENDCLVNVVEVATGRLLWAAPGCVGRRTQRLYPAPDGDRLLVVDPSPVADPDDAGRTLVAELRRRNEVVRRWRAFETPGDPERFREGRRIAWVKLGPAGLAITAQAAGVVIEQRDGVLLRLDYGAAARPDVLPAAPVAPGCPVGPCRFVDAEGAVHLVGSADEVPEAYLATARPLRGEVNVEPRRLVGDATQEVQDARRARPEAPAEGGSGAPEVQPDTRPAPAEPNHFDRVRQMLGLPGGGGPATPNSGECQLQTDPATGATTTVCR